LNNSFKIVFVISSYRDWDLNRGNHQIKEFPRVADYSSNSMLGGAEYFEETVLGGYINVFVNISSPSGTN